jgi:hypothetical protein
MTDFWQRLTQRKLVQWALAYVAAAFALLQGIDIVAGKFGWPAQFPDFARKTRLTQAWEKYGPPDDCERKGAGDYVCH